MQAFQGAWFQTKRDIYQRFFYSVYLLSVKSEVCETTNIPRIQRTLKKYEKADSIYLM